MAGRSLANLAAGAGAAANRGISGAKGSLFGVAQEAVRGQYAAEAQERAHGHTKKMVRDIHKRAGEGTRVSIEIGADGNHRIGYNKKMIGENYRERVEQNSIKEHFGKNPQRDAQGYRHNQPDHVGNAQQAAQGAIEHRPIEPMKVNIKNRPMLALEAPKKKPAEGPQVDQNHQDKTEHFVTDSKGGTRRVDRRDGSFESHLGDNEAAYLAQRKAKLDSVKNAGRPSASSTPKDELF